MSSFSAVCLCHFEEKDRFFSGVSVPLLSFRAQSFGAAELFGAELFRAPRAVVPRI